MGVLTGSIEVNQDSASCRRVVHGLEPFGTMGTPGEAYFTEAFHTIAINTRETEFGRLVQPIPITVTRKQIHAHGLNGFAFPPQQMIATFGAITRVPDIEMPSVSYMQNPVKEDVKNSEKIRPPPKKKWIKEYLEEEPKSGVSVRLVADPALPLRNNGVVRPPSPPKPVQQHALAPAPALTSASVLPHALAPSPALTSAPTLPPTPALPLAPVLQPAPVLPPTPAPAPTPTSAPTPAPALSIDPTPLLDFVQEHSRARTTSNSHGPPQIPSPPSVGSSGSASSGSGSGGGAPRAGTREVHNKLEKNRRAHLKECFELLKRQLPATPDDKKTSNLSILHSAIRYIQVLRRKERECEHEMERLAREKIASQQRLSTLKREVTVRAAALPRILDLVTDEKDKDDRINGQVLGIPISITTSSTPVTRMESSSSPPRTLNMSTKLRTLPIQITPTTSQVVRTTYGARHNTLTLTTLAPAETNTQNGQIVENGISTLVHPAHIHLPISQVVNGSGLMVGSALQLVSTGGGLRVLQTAHRTNGMTTAENNRIGRENGIVSPPPVTTESGGVVVSGLTPIVVSQPGGHLLHTHTFTHNMVETQVVKGSVTPLTVSTQYLSAATIVKPMVVVSGAPSPPARPS